MSGFKATPRWQPPSDDRVPLMVHPAARAVLHQLLLTPALCGSPAGHPLQGMGFSEFIWRAVQVLRNEVVTDVEEATAMAPGSSHYPPDPLGVIFDSLAPEDWVPAPGEGEAAPEVPEPADAEVQHVLTWAACHPEHWIAVGFRDEPPRLDFGMMEYGDQVGSMRYATFATLLDGHWFAVTPMWGSSRTIYRLTAEGRARAQELA